MAKPMSGLQIFSHKKVVKNGGEMPPFLTNKLNIITKCNYDFN
tara:strand:- start:719 stop:847 length:129 start_codon:yes stop_codon:yes gene_type:complete